MECFNYNFIWSIFYVWNYSNKRSDPNNIHHLHKVLDDL